MSVSDQSSISTVSSPQQEQPNTPDGQHQFHFSVTVQGGGCDWVGEPFRLTVRADSLTEACAKAAGTRLPGWTHPDDEQPADPDLTGGAQ